MSYKERIATNVKWDVDEMDAVMYLCDLSAVDCAYSLNVDVYEFEAMSLGDKIRLMKQTYSGEENINKLYELLNLPTNVPIPDDVCYIDSYLYNKYAYHTKSFDVEKRICDSEQNWYIVVTSTFLSNPISHNTKIMTFKSSHKDVKQKIFELYTKYRCKHLSEFLKGANSVDDIECDNDENPTRYTVSSSYKSVNLIITAYDADKVEPLA